MKHLIRLICAISAISSIQAQGQLASHKAIEPVFIITLPKSGTNMLQKLLHLIYGIEPNSRCNSPYDHWNIQDFSLPIHSHPYSYFDRFIKENNKKILLVRDIRDVFVSLYFHFESVNGVPSSNPNYPQLSKDEKIKFLIVTDEPYFGMKFYTDQVLKWSRHPETLVITLVIKFEDLVGLYGRGSIEAQTQTIQTICNYLNIQRSEYQILYISYRLFGNTSTFRKGQIGDWKNHLNQEHLELIAKYYSDWMKELGYAL